MMYAVLFEDDDKHADKRPLYLPEHLAFLADHAGQISAAGPLADASSGESAGGLWLVEADDTEAVEALIHEDPFWSTGLRKSCRILRWTQVFADGQKLVQAL
jgi:uncharacterized protein YciI